MPAVHKMQYIMNSECSMCCPLALTKASLLHCEWSRRRVFLTQELDCRTCTVTFTTPAHWPADNLFKHNLREILFHLRLCTQIILILEHFDKVMLKSDTCFMRKSTVELARYTGVLFCNDVTVSIATTQVVLDLYQTFHAQLLNW